MRKKVFRNKQIVVGGSILLLLVIVAMTSNFFTSYHPHSQDLNERLLAPGKSSHLLGTDEFGRDVYARIVYGSRISLKVGFLSVSIALFGGCFLGLVSGYSGGRADMLLGRVNDILMAFPPLLLALMIVAALGPSLNNAIIAIGITLIPRFYRVVRASTLVVRERTFIQAAKAMGSGTFQLICRHIVPNVLSPIIVVASLAMGNAILTEAELSYLGLGAQPPIPSWGSIVSDGNEYLDIAPWISIFAGLAVMIVVLGSNIFGDGLRDFLDPKLKA